MKIISILNQFLLVLFSSFLITTVSWSQEIILLKNGKQVQLNDNMTWEYIKGQATQGRDDYQELDFVDLKLDIKALHGKKIKVKGQGMFFADMFMFSQGPMDANPLIVDISKVSRDQRKYLLSNCSVGCSIFILGVVGTVMFQDGLIAHSIKL